MTRIERLLASNVAAYNLGRLAKSLLRLDARYASYACELLAANCDFGPVSVARLGLDPAEANRHGDSGGPDLADVLEVLDLRSTDSVIDVGCGKGAALATLARFPHARLTGVDLSREMVEIARKNLAKLKVVADLHPCDARAFPDYGDFSFVYMCNPFPAPVVAATASSIVAARAGRSVRLLYKFPRHEDVLLELGFRRTFRQQKRTGLFSVYVKE